MKLGSNLSKVSKKAGLTITQLAKLSGVPVQTLHGWTAGKAVANLQQLRQVATALEVSLYELAFGEPDPFEKPGEEILKEIFSGDVRVTLHRIERSKSK